uniref:Uncharacterized protein n=1 Tax=viral metagenome TaxID=1070528 RepID=A0A6M3KUB0_9ZZZZ
MKKIILPKTAKVGPYNYKVIFPYSFEEDQDMLGLSDHKCMYIKVAEEYGSLKMTNIRVLEIFMHELVHSIDFCYFSERMEENTVIELGRSITQVLTDNNLKLYDKNYFPKKIRVGCFTYSIVYNHKFADSYKDDSAAVNHINQKIHIRDSRTNSEEFSFEYKKALLLEMIVSSMVYVYNIELPEMFNAEIFANGLYQVIVDNKIEQLISNTKLN